MNPNGLIKIELAAKWLEVSPKTIHNWIEDGLLEMPEKGKVRRADVERVHSEKIMKRSSIDRDKNGRFVIFPKSN